MKRLMCVATLLVSMVALMGCGEDGSRVKTEYVEGIVTLNGKPLSMAHVTFNPVGGEGQAAFGSSDKDGKYLLTTDGGKTDGGALAGEYVVTVEKRDVPPPVEVSPDPNKPAPPIKVQAAPLITPAKYADVKSTDLKVTVVKGSNEIKLELVGKK